MPPADLRARLRHACATLDRRLRGGEGCRAEELLADDPVLAADPDALLELAYTEFAVREELGHAPDPADTLARFPAIRTALAEQLQIHTLIHAEPPPAAVDVGRRVGPYELLDQLGRGTGGRVFRARHVTLGRVVALKLVPAAAKGAGEAWAAAKLEHPNIVRLYDVGVDRAGSYLAMEYVAGGTLADRLAGHPLPAAATAELVEAVARGAHHAHTHGVVHRDIKPANVLLAPTGEGGVDRDDDPTTSAGTPGSHRPPPAAFVAKLADFGLAAGGDGGAAEGTVGTPGYMAPEQARGEADVGPVADVYALGAVLYECLTGRPPFRADTPLHTLEQALTSDPIPPRRLNPRVPRDLETVCLKCLHRSPARRYSSAAALADDLARWRAGRPVTARPVGAAERAWKWAKRQPVVAALVALLAATGAGVAAAGVWTNAQLRAARDAAEHDARVAREAYEEARRDVYTTQLAQVNNLYQTDPGRALALLDDPARCPPDLRDFAWGLFHSQCRHDVRTVTGVGVVKALTFSPDGRTLRADRADDSRAWAVATGEPCEPFPDPPAAFSVKSDTAGVVVTDRATGRRLRLKLGFRPSSAVADPTGRRVAVIEGSRQTRLAVWDAERGHELAAAPDPHVLFVRALVWSPDGRWLASGGVDRVVRVWDAATLREVAALRGHSGPVRSLAFSPDGRLVASAADDSTVRVWPVDPPAPGPERAAGNDAKITALAFTPDGAAVVVATAAGEVKQWGLPFAGPPRVLAETRTNLLALAVAPDGRLAVGGMDGVVRVLAPGGATTGATPGYPSAVRGLAWSPDGRRLAAACEDGVVRAWEGGVGRLIGEWRAAPGHARGVEFAPDSRTLAVAASDRAVLWDVDAGEARGDIPGHGEGLLFARFRPGHGTLVTGGLSCDVQLWRPDEASPDHTLAGHTLSVVGAAFTPDGRTLATGSGNRFANVPGEVKLWDVGTGHLRATLAGQTGPLAFSPSGAILATIEDHTSVRLWRPDRPGGARP